MKKLFIGLLFCLGCEQNISKNLEADTHGHVFINGKDCEVFTVGTGSGGSRVYFIDCGPGSSSVTYQAGKVLQSVGQYTPPAASSSENVCHCPNTDEIKKIQEIKKDFYK